MTDALTFLPPWAVLAPFLAAALALNLTPGADMTYVMARAVAQGRRAGLVSALAITAGSLVHTLAAVVGLSAVVLASPLAFQTIKYLGAAYLLYLGVKLILARPEPPGTGVRAHRLPRVFWEGVLVNVLNPKVALFILAFLPQFVDPARGQVPLQILVLGTLFNLGGTLVNLGVAQIASAGAARLQHATRFQRAMNVLAGTILGGLALRLAFTSR
ncbi:MAG: LysE family translocator [Rhodovibrionaceae bacterium]|nr:LysE family translocator [Rhodovibrionaceae bacterium]